MNLLICGLFSLTYFSVVKENKPTPLPYEILWDSLQASIALEVFSIWWHMLAFWL